MKIENCVELIKIILNYSNYVETIDSVFTFRLFLQDLQEPLDFVVPQLN